MSALTVIAYLDPGTGALLVQVIIGAVVGCGVWFRKYVIATVARVFLPKAKSTDEANSRGK